MGLTTIASTLAPTSTTISIAAEIAHNAIMHACIARMPTQTLTVIFVIQLLSIRRITLSHLLQTLLHYRTQIGSLVIALKELLQWVMMEIFACNVILDVWYALTS